MGDTNGSNRIGLMEGRTITMNNDTEALNLIDQQVDLSSFQQDCHLTTLVDRILEQKWEEALTNFDTSSPADRYRVLQYVFCYQLYFPLYLFQAIVNPQVTSHQDEYDRTLLHLAVEYSNQPTAYVRALMVYANPEVRNIEGLRAIDILTSKILMKQERRRYHSTGSSTLDEYWECARVLVQAGEQMLHGLLQATDIPLALLEGALRRYPDELSIPDDQGNLPAHLVAARLDMDEMFFTDTIQAYKAALDVRNANGEYPLNVAIQAGRTMDTGIADLLDDAHPEAIEQLDISDAHFGMIFYELRNVTLQFALLRAKPGRI
jgi:hypothetical protein